MRSQFLCLAVCLVVGLTVVPAASQTAGGDPHPSAMQVEKSSAGLAAHNDYETLQVTVCGEALVHVVGRPAGAQGPSSARPWILEQAQSCPGAPFQFTQTGDTATLTTAKIQVVL